MASAMQFGLMTARLMAMLAFATPGVTAFGVPARRPCLHHRTAAALPRISMVSDKDIADAVDVWNFRADFTRGTFKNIVEFKEDSREARERRTKRNEEDGGAAAKSAFTASATAVIVGAFVLRLGGRAALVSILGLDMVADLGIGDQIDQVLQYSQDAGSLTIVAFLAAWVVAKVFLIDLIALALAFSSGVLFGGVLEGAALSALGATLGSLTALTLSRTLLQEKVEGAISKRPVARGLAKVVEEDGFKTVLVLRLAPILPIPTGAYPYIYGTSKLSPSTFAAGYFIGSLKPYLLDAYLGIFSKQIIDGDSLDSQRDLILLVGLGVLVLVGVFATELANESWDLVQKEISADKLRRAKLGDEADEAEEPDENAGMIGPLNTTAFSESAVGLLPDSLRAELGETWRTLGEFCDAQWVPSVQQAVTFRRAQKAEQDRIDSILQAAKNGTRPISDTLAVLAQEPLKPPDDTLTRAERDARKRIAEWSLKGDESREWVGTLLFSFALAKAASRQWSDYPTTTEELDAIVASGATTASVAAVAGSAGVAGVGEGGTGGASAEDLAARAAALAAREANLEASFALAQAEIVQRLAKIEARQAVIDTRLAMMSGTADEWQKAQVEALESRQAEIEDREAEIMARLAQLQEADDS